MQSRTAKLWIKYIEMIDLLRDFIRAERTGDWHLHLSTLRSMLPFFAATSHNLYAKSVYLYLSKMNKLPSTHPKLYECFVKGFHVIRRSDRFWAGLSTDLVIEQALMRSLKCAGGLTRGRGMTEIQRAVWILSRPATSSIHEAMEKFSGVEYSSSEQHKDTTHAVRKRDTNDTKIMTQYLEDRNPFKLDKDLKSIVTGVVSLESNADAAEEIGEKVIKRMSGQKVTDFTFRKKDAVITMNDKSAVRIDDDNVTVDPQLLFQRLVTAANRLSNEPNLPLSYELCTFPPALFESKRLMRAADKPVLAKAIKTTDNPSPKFHETSSSIYSIVVDGGMLLQWVHWEEGKTFVEICTSYIHFLRSRYSNCIVVFDGYESGPTTKDVTHLRRNKGMVGSEVRFTNNSVFRGKISTFLNNICNKQQFINMLSNEFNKVDIETLHADSDADLLIVLTAVKCSHSKPTILVGEDTDLLVLLCYYAKSFSQPIFLQARPKFSNSESWDIHKLQAHLGNDVCSNILFLHAVLGCDTTSRIHGIRKGAAIRAFQNCQLFRDCASVFLLEPCDVSKESIITSGERTLVHLFKGKKGVTLDNLRVCKFAEKVAKSSTFVDPKQLPPTSDAAQFHSLRVCLQIQQWKGNTDADPLEWGWELVGNTLFPITTTKPAGPEHILKVVRCTCTAGCRTKACSCKKLGLECNPACSSCKGVSCENALQPDLGSEVLDVFDSYDINMISTL